MHLPIIASMINYLRQYHLDVYLVVHWCFKLQVLVSAFTLNQLVSGSTNPCLLGHKTPGKTFDWGLLLAYTWNDLLIRDGTASVTPSADRTLLAVLDESQASPCINQSVR
jgi:hypothetical protein